MIDVVHVKRRGVIMDERTSSGRTKISLADFRDRTQALYRYLAEIDEHLAREGVPTRGRSLAAYKEMAADGFVFAVGFGSGAEAVDEWFSGQYGVKVGRPDLGSIAVLVRGDVYRMWFPVTFGRPTLKLHQVIEGLTVARASSLEPAAASQLIATFLDTFQLIERVQVLPSLVLVELETVVQRLMKEPPECGGSRWASQMLAEKSIKHFIRVRGETARPIHDLRKLAEHAERLRLPELPRNDIDDASCTSNARYGVVPTTVGEAMAAQHAAIRIAAHVADHVRQ